jgi:hypothetical protein
MQADLRSGRLGTGRMGNARSARLTRIRRQIDGLESHAIATIVFTSAMTKPDVVAVMLGPRLRRRPRGGGASSRNPERDSPE